jgi:3,4-dihydroxy 2-butanone 4-phosphate synthase/GTP cyclohydrolase II
LRVAILELMPNELQKFEELVRNDINWMKLKCPSELDCANCEERLCLKVVAVADFPTDYGHFRVIAFANNKDGKDHTVILKGEIGDGKDILTRIHSACLTGDALGSRRCDCGPQLHHALSLIEKEGRGIVLYHQAEGRGIGLANKLRAYVLQDGGMDTLEANVALGFAADERDYEIPAAMLRKLGVESVRLMTNNPEKVEAVEKHGIKVTDRVDHEPGKAEENRKYLKTKKEKFGHFLHVEEE